MHFRGELRLVGDGGEQTINCGLIRTLEITYIKLYVYIKVLTYNNNRRQHVFRFLKINKKYIYDQIWPFFQEENSNVGSVKALAHRFV